MTVDGLIVRNSNYSPGDTMQRLIEALGTRGVPVVAHIDHAAAAAKAGLEMRPTDLLIFGSAKSGTPLMAASQSLGIDLPLKMLVWQDEGGITRLGYNDSVFLARRHGAQAGNEHILSAMRELLAAVAAQAAG